MPFDCAGFANQLTARAAAHPPRRRLLSSSIFPSCVSHPCGHDEQVRMLTLPSCRLSSRTRAALAATRRHSRRGTARVLRSWCSFAQSLKAYLLLMLLAFLSYL